MAWVAGDQLQGGKYTIEKELRRGRFGITYLVKNNKGDRDGINKAAKLIIDHCLIYNIGTLVIGWNEGFKSNANMGRLNNQNFVQMPLGKLKDRQKSTVRFTRN